MLPGFSSDTMPQGNDKASQMMLRRFITIIESMNDKELDTTQVKMLQVRGGWGEARLRRRQWLWGGMRSWGWWGMRHAKAQVLRGGGCTYSLMVLHLPRLCTPNCRSRRAWRG